jgi:hypothetical protein
MRVCYKIVLGRYKILIPLRVCPSVSHTGEKSSEEKSRRGAFLLSDRA